MYQIKASIKGLSPLRHNRFIESKATSGMSKKKSDDDRIKEAFERAYYDDKKGFYIPKQALKRVICEGGKKVKIGRGSASAVFKAILILDEDMYFIGTKEHEIYKEAVRIPPRTGARVMQHWVINQEWEATFTATILDDVVPADAVKESIQFAGMYYGLLDGRPEFGRFELTDFSKIEKKNSK